MKHLESEFKSNADQCGLHTFKQIKYTNKGALYQRIRSDGTTHSFETFKIKVVKAGTKLPNGLQVTEDYVKYPTKNDFGKWAYSCHSLNHAESRYEQIVKENLNTEDIEVDLGSDDSESIKTNDQIGATKGKRGRKAKTVKMPIPKKGEKFTMKNLMAWSGESQPILYIRLKSLVEAGMVNIAGEVREAHTRGKAQILYISNTDEFVNDLPQGE